MQQQFELIPFRGGELYHGSPRSASYKLMPECVQVCLSDNGKLHYREVKTTEQARDMCKTWIERGEVKHATTV